ncbi:MAG: NUDIX hydrolase [Chloroflexota bacterium]
MPDNHTPMHIVAVSGLVRDALGRILMVNSPKRGWEFPGGQVEEGESLPEALIREILEETGTVTTIGALTGIYSNVKMPTIVIFGFLCDYVSGELTTSAESTMVEWVAPDIALSRVTHPAIHERLKDMLAFDGRIIYRVYQTEPYTMLSERWL